MSETTINQLNEEMEWVEFETIELPMEDGTTITCAVVDEFDIDEKSYVVLAPVREDQTIDEEEEYFYRCEPNGEDVILTIIEDEEEMMWVQLAHNEIFDDEEDEQ